METTRSIEALRQRLDAMKDEMNGVKKDVSVEGRKKAEAYHTAFWEHMHTGVPENALKKGSDGSGGYLVPDTFEDRLVEGLREKNVMRVIGTTLPTTNRLRIPHIVDGGHAEWVPEGGAFADSDITLGETIIDAYKVGTSILISDELLEDAGFNLEEYISRIFAERIGDCEELAFIAGDGIGKPLGILSQAPVGVISETAGELHLDDVISLQYSVRAPYRSNAAWLMSENAYIELRKIRSANGRPLWPSNLAKGEPEILLGHRVYVSKNLPDIAPGAKPVLFGDFSFFWIGDRGKRTVKRLSERYADYGQVGFLAHQRVDAKLVLPEAVKALEIRSVEQAG